MASRSCNPHDKTSGRALSEVRPGKAGRGACHTLLGPPLACKARGAIEAAAGLRSNPGTDGRRLPVPGPRPGRAVHRIVRCGSSRRRYRSREDSVPKPQGERLCRTVRTHCPDGGHRPDADLRRTTPAAGPSRVRGARQRRATLSQPPSSARPGRTAPSPASPRSGSSAGPSSAASSTNTREPHRSPGQVWWPSSGTPQG